ncbi:hypothetical protein D3C85_1640820 [compost metagenome]
MANSEFDSIVSLCLEHRRALFLAANSAEHKQGCFQDNGVPPEPYQGTNIAMSKKASTTPITVIPREVK